MPNVKGKVNILKRLLTIFISVVIIMMFTIGCTNNEVPPAGNGNTNPPATENPVVPGETENPENPDDNTDVEEPATP